MKMRYRKNGGKKAGPGSPAFLYPYFAFTKARAASSMRQE